MRRVFVLICTSALFAAGFAVTTATTASAAPLGYTIEVNGTPNNGCRLATIDVASGAVDGIGSFLNFSTYVCAADLAFAPSGVLYGVSDNRVSVSAPGSIDGDSPDGSVDGEAAAVFQVHLVRYDLTSGAVTDLGKIGTGEASLGSPEAGGIAFDAAGNLFVSMIGTTDACAGTAFCLYKVDPTNPAAATFIGPMASEAFFFALTTTCTTMYSSRLLEETSTQLSIVSPTTAAITGVGTNMGTARVIHSLEIDPATGTLWGLGIISIAGVTPSKVFTIDTTTGVATAGASIRPFVQGLAIGAPTCPVPPPPPPEPPPPPPVVIPLFTG